MPASSSGRTTTEARRRTSRLRNGAAHQTNQATRPVPTTTTPPPTTTTAPATATSTSHNSIAPPNSSNHLAPPSASHTATPSPIPSAASSSSPIPIPSFSSSSPSPSPTPTLTRVHTEPNHHHEFRMQVVDVNPVSITLLLSLRPSPLTAISAPTSTSSALFHQGISVSVDGISWKHVLMSDGSGASLSPTQETQPTSQPALNITPSGGEVVLVVFGLRPGRTCVVQVYVGAIAMASLVRRPPPIPSPVPVHTSEDKISAPDQSNAAEVAALQEELSHWENQKAEAQARVRSARRDAAKSEQALRSNIEAARRARERASGLESRARARAATLGEQVRKAQDQAAQLRTQAEQSQAEASATAEEDQRRLEQLDYELQQAKEELGQAGAEAEEANKENAELLSAQKKELEQLEKQVSEVQAQVASKQSESLPKLHRELDALKLEIASVAESTDQVLASPSHALNAPPEEKKPPPPAPSLTKRSKHVRTSSASQPTQQQGHGRRRDRGRHWRAQQQAAQHAAEGTSSPTSRRSLSASPHSSPALQNHPWDEHCGSTSSQSQTATPRLNPKQPEFVPSSVLHAQAQAQAQRANVQWLGTSGTPLRSPTLGPSKLGPIGPPSSRTSSGSHVPSTSSYGQQPPGLPPGLSPGLSNSALRSSSSLPLARFADPSVLDPFGFDDPLHPFARPSLAPGSTPTSATGTSGGNANPAPIGSSRPAHASATWGPPTPGSAKGQSQVQGQWSPVRSFADIVLRQP